MLRIIGMLFVYWFDDVVAVFLVDAVSQQLWQRDQQVPVLPRHAERVPPWWCLPELFLQLGLFMISLFAPMVSH